MILPADKFKFRSGELHFSFAGFNEVTISLVACHWHAIPDIKGEIHLRRPDGQKSSVQGFYWSPIPDRPGFLHRPEKGKIPAKTQTAIHDAILDRINKFLIHEKDFEAQCIRAERRVLNKKTEQLTTALQDARVKVNQTGHELEEARTNLRNWEARFKGIF